MFHSYSFLQIYVKIWEYAKEFIKIGAHRDVYTPIGIFVILELEFEGFCVAFSLEDEDIDAQAEVEVALGSVFSLPL